jgi:hypothetical protein
MREVRYCNLCKKPNENLFVILWYKEGTMLDKSTPFCEACLPKYIALKFSRKSEVKVEKS